MAEGFMRRANEIKIQARSSRSIADNQTGAKFVKKASSNAPEFKTGFRSVFAILGVPGRLLHTSRAVL
jgi:hypothetical protein